MAPDPPGNEAGGACDGLPRTCTCFLHITFEFCQLFGGSQVLEDWWLHDAYVLPGL